MSATYRTTQSPCIPTLLRRKAPPSEIMPLSTFLTMQGCSTTDIARDGTCNHGAGCLSSAWLAETCSVFMSRARRESQLPRCRDGGGEAAGLRATTRGVGCKMGGFGALSLPAAALAPLARPRIPRPMVLCRGAADRPLAHHQKLRGV